MYLINMKTKKKKIKIRRGIKIKKKNKSFKKLKCAPGPNKELDFTCYSKKSLIKMRNLWNTRHPDSKIKSCNAREIWNKLKVYMNDMCNIESCWLKQKFIQSDLDKELLNYTFAPKAPTEWKRNPQEWLSSLDIISVMKQYEYKFPCFDFIGPSPINYDTHVKYGECVWKELCEFELYNMIQKGKNKIGVIFNLDPHYKNGSHWVALFINIKKGRIYFFDSYGLDPHKQIQKFIDTVKRQGKSLNIYFKQENNKTRHQFSNSECGMYSLYFIIQMLYDTPFEEFEKQRVSDSKMIELRKEYFNHI